MFAEGMTVTFAPSALPIPRVESLNVTIIDDMVVESDHSFNVSITGTSLSLVTVGTPSSVEVFIIDNDGQSPYIYTCILWCQLYVEIVIYM